LYGPKLKHAFMSDTLSSFIISTEAHLKVQGEAADNRQEWILNLGLVKLGQEWLQVVAGQCAVTPLNLVELYRQQDIGQTVNKVADVHQ
jgi:hypothetical protein